MPSRVDPLVVTTRRRVDRHQPLGGLDDADASQPSNNSGSSGKSIDLTRKLVCSRVVMRSFQRAVIGLPSTRTPLASSACTTDSAWDGSKRPPTRPCFGSSTPPRGASERARSRVATSPHRKRANTCPAMPARDQPAHALSPNNRTVRRRRGRLPGQAEPHITTAEGNRPRRT
jgi:hypothetical protein